jgi:cell division protease FtsH
MVTEWGFASDRLGMTAWDTSDRDSLFRSGSSEETEQAIDAAVTEICREAYETTSRTLREHRKLLDTVTERLLEKETIDGLELAKLVEDATGSERPNRAPHVTVRRNVSSNQPLHAFNAEEVFIPKAESDDDRR